MRSWQRCGAPRLRLPRPTHNQPTHNQGIAVPFRAAPPSEPQSRGPASWGFVLCVSAGSRKACRRVVRFPRSASRILHLPFPMTRPPRFLQRTLRAPRAARIICCGLLITLWQPAHAQHAPSVNTIEKIDVSVAQRDENLLAYTVTELYRLFRNGDRVRPAAEMTVKTTYRRDTGKSSEHIP